jgi:hypothetical protein
MSSTKIKSLIRILLVYVIVALSISICVFAALTASINVPTFHLDGAFQTASGLFRLDSGQLPGRDFYPYLGIGPLFAIFPIYKIVGADLAATVFAAKFLTIFLGWFAVSVLWHLLLRPANIFCSIIGGSLVFFGFEFITDKLLIENPLSFMMDPGNSLRPVRSALPYLMAIILYFIIKKFENNNFRNFLIGGVLGVALLWSNDFALPTFLVFFTFSFFYFYFFEKTSWKQSAAKIIVISLIIWVALLHVVTSGHSFDLLRYNFIDVAKDQWWYFGPYGPNFRIFEIRDFFKLLSVKNYFPIIVIFFVMILSLKYKKIELYFVALIGLTLFAGGTLASIGGHLGGYFGGLYFWGTVTSVVLFFKALVLAADRTKWFSSFYLFLFLFSAFLMLIFIADNTWRDYRKNFDTAQSDPEKFYVNELGGFIHNDYSGYVKYALQHREKVATEDYWGLWSSLHRNFPPWPVDSVIHALGGVRQLSEKSLESTDFVITTRYLISPDWHPWNLSQNFWFYGNLFSNWKPVFISPSTVVWSREKFDSNFQSVECKISSDKMSIIINTNDFGFYKIHLSYSSSGKRHLVQFKNNISYAVDASGYISLMPGAHRSVFPVRISGQTGNQFDIRALGKAAVSISECTATRFNHMSEELLSESMFSKEAFTLSDEEVNAAVKEFPIFIVENNFEKRNKYSINSVVKFENGEQRNIVYASEHGAHLAVWVKGSVLDIDKIGSPDKFEVTQ